MPVSQMPGQHVLFMCFGVKLDFRCASRQALQSSSAFLPLTCSKACGLLYASSSFLSHLINSQALQGPLVMMLPALLASAFSQQSNLLRIEIFNLKVLQPVYGNVGEIYHRPAVMLWLLLNSESYCRMFVCTDRNEKWGGEEKETEKRLPGLNYSRMRTLQKQSCWIFSLYRKLLVGISIKYGLNDWFWLLSLTTSALCLLGLVAVWEPLGNQGKK